MVTFETIQPIIMSATPFAPMGSYQKPQRLRIPRVQYPLDSSSSTKMLPSDFEPSPYSVIFGRTKKCTQACGNRRLRVFAMIFLDKYAKASTRDQKSAIVTEIQSTIEEACPEKRGAFVRPSGGRWIEVNSIVAREKISQVLRDILHSKYRSSVKNKMAVRRKRKMQSQSSISSTETESTDEAPSTEFSSELLVSRDSVMM
jgi:hypothetical protein